MNENGAVMKLRHCKSLKTGQIGVARKLDSVEIPPDFDTESDSVYLFQDEKKELRYVLESDIEFLDD